MRHLTAKRRGWYGVGHSGQSRQNPASGAFLIRSARAEEHTVRHTPSHTVAKSPFSTSVFAASRYGPRIAVLTEGKDGPMNSSIDPDRWRAMVASVRNGATDASRLLPFVGVRSYWEIVSSAFAAVAGVREMQQDDEPASSTQA